MSNTLASIMPKILARGLLSLRELAAMPRLVNGSYSSEAAQKGTTIDVPLAASQTASDVVPNNTDPTPASKVPKVVQIVLDQWKQTDFHLTDKEMVEVDKNAHFMPLQVDESIRALAQVVNQHIHSKYSGIYGWVGTAGTTPFASTVTDATNARKVLNQQRAYKSNRRGVLDFDAEANALALSPFSDAEKIGSNGVKIEGEIGRKYGIDWVADDDVATHTAGSLQTTGGFVASTTAAGASAIGVTASSTGAELVVGDIFTIAGDTQTYVVKATVSGIASAAESVVTFQPELVQSATANAAITVKDTHVVNMVFHRDAFAFANRPLVSASSDLSLGSQIMSMTDPQTGITLRLEVRRQYKQVVWEFDLLWGSELVRPELAARVGG